MYLVAGAVEVVSCLRMLRSTILRWALPRHNSLIVVVLPLDLLVPLVLVLVLDPIRMCQANQEEVQARVRMVQTLRQEALVQALEQVALRKLLRLEVRHALMSFSLKVNG